MSRKMVKKKNSNSKLAIYIIIIAVIVMVAIALLKAKYYSSPSLSPYRPASSIPSPSPSPSPCPLISESCASGPDSISTLVTGFPENGYNTVLTECNKNIIDCQNNMPSAENKKSCESNKNCQYVKSRYNTGCTAECSLIDSQTNDGEYFCVGYPDFKYVCERKN